MSFQTEREMFFLERNRYIQVCRENEYAVLYYDNKEEKIIRYKTGKKFSFSLKYQLCILVTLYLGYLLNAKVYMVLAQNSCLKHFIAFLCLSIGYIGLLFFENDIAKKIKNEGVEVPYILSDELLQKRTKGFKNAKNDHISMDFDFRGNSVDILPDEFCYGFGTIFSQHDCFIRYGCGNKTSFTSKIISSIY